MVERAQPHARAVLKLTCLYDSIRGGDEAEATVTLDEPLNTASTKEESLWTLDAAARAHRDDGDYDYDRRPSRRGRQGRGQHGQQARAAGLVPWRLNVPLPKKALQLMGAARNGSR